MSSTRALDVVTILHALSELDSELKTTAWAATNEEQKKVFALLDVYREELAKVTGLDAKASRDYGELNAFLTKRKFDPMVEPFDPKIGIGVVSVLDKLVQWIKGPGEKVEILTAKGERPGFELPREGVNVYEVAGYPKSYLLELLTKSDDTLWLFVHDDTTLDGLDLVGLSMDVMSQARTTPMRESHFGRGKKYQAFAGAQVPMLDFNIKPGLDWLLGAATGTGYFITQAVQQFKMRMDETGARVKVATVVVASRCIKEEPVVFVLNRPFYGWWTQKGLNMPMAAFFADWDSLHEPAGSLSDL